MGKMAIEFNSTRNFQMSVETMPAIFPAKPEDAVRLPPKISDSSASDSPDLKETYESLKKATDKVNRILSGTPMKFEFSFHKSSRFIGIKVIDSVTNKVVTEIPSERFFEFMDNLPEVSGAIFDEKG
jgi:uncharacterized FlaG/YvyC family protein